MHMHVCAHIHTHIEICSVQNISHFLSYQKAFPYLDYIIVELNSINICLRHRLFVSLTVCVIDILSLTVCVIDFMSLTVCIIDCLCH